MINKVEHTLHCLFYLRERAKEVQNAAGDFESYSLVNSQVDFARWCHDNHKPVKFNFLFGLRQSDSSNVGMVKLALNAKTPNITVIYETTKNVHALTRRGICAHSSKLVDLFSQDNGALPLHLVTARNADTISLFQGWFSSTFYQIAGCLRFESSVYDYVFPLKDGVFLPLLFCDNTYYSVLSNHAKEEIVSVLMQYLKPAFVRGEEEKIFVTPNTINLAELSLFEAASLKKDSQVGCFGTFNTDKGVEMIFPVLENIFKAGLVKRVVATTQDASSGIKIIPPRCFDVQYECDRKSFYKEAAKTKVALFNSVYEAVSFAMLECMFLRVVPVFPDREWAHRLMPDNSYPFFFTSPGEAFAMVKKALKDHEKWSEFVHNFVVENYSPNDRHELFYSQLRGVCESTSPVFGHSLSFLKGKYRFIDEVEVFLKRKKSFSIEDHHNWLTKLSRFRSGTMFSVAEKCLLFEKFGFMFNIETGKFER